MEESQRRYTEWKKETKNKRTHNEWFHLYNNSIIHGGKNQNRASLVASGKESTWNVGDVGLTPKSRRSPREGNGNPIQYSCLRNPTDRGAWWATVHGAAKSRTRLRDWTTQSSRRVLTSGWVGGWGPKGKGMKLLKFTKLCTWHLCIFLVFKYSSIIKSTGIWEFPGSLCFHCWGPRFNPWLGN